MNWNIAAVLTMSSFGACKKSEPFLLQMNKTHDFTKVHEDDDNDSCMFS